LLVGAALAPTDAALGSAVISNPVVPAPIRSILHVESGLHDRIVSTLVVLGIAGAAAAEHHGSGAAHAAAELVLGVAIGVAVGLAGGHLMRFARSRSWVDEAFAGPAVLSLAILTYAVALWGNGNGF